MALLNELHLRESDLTELVSDIWTGILADNTNLRITTYETRFKDADSRTVTVERYQIWEDGELVVDKYLTKVASGRFVCARALYDEYKRDYVEWLALISEAQSEGIIAKDVRKFIENKRNEAIM